MITRRVALAGLALAILPAPLRAERCPDTDPKAAITVFGPVETEALARSAAVRLVDVREQAEWDAGHIASALLSSLSSFQAGLETLPRETPILFYCRSGRRSLEAATRARAHGLPVCGHMGGGILAWVQAGLPVVRSLNPPGTHPSDAPASRQARPATHQTGHRDRPGLPSASTGTVPQL
jgi:hydroxyacylglutathione hydrolase